MKILWFGGTFDPPHNGHVSLLRACIQTVQPDVVLVVPAGRPPHKAFAGTDGALRLEMCRAAFAPCFENLLVDDIELRRTGKSYSLDTLSQLRQRWPSGNFYLCVGSDMLTSFEKWYRYEEILKAVTLVPHLRDLQDSAQAAQAAAALAAKGGRILPAQGPVTPLSSTQVRKACQAGQSIEGLVPPAVAAIIARHHLYEKEAMEMELTPKNCELLASRMLSPVRFHHVQCVRDQAVALARRFGADPGKAEIAALLHDITKELPAAQHLQWLRTGGIINETATHIPEKVWHSYTGAIYAREQLGLQDQEIFDAIFYHTTARSGMSLLDKVIYMADKTSAERDYAGVEALRGLLDKGQMNQALYISVAAGLEKVRRKNGAAMPDTLAALAALEDELAAGEEQ